MRLICCKCNEIITISTIITHCDKCGYHKFMVIGDAVKIMNSGTTINVPKDFKFPTYEEDRKVFTRVNLTEADKEEINKTNTVMRKILERMQKEKTKLGTRELSEAITQLEYAIWRHDNYCIESGAVKV